MACMPRMRASPLSETDRPARSSTRAPTRPVPALGNQARLRRLSGAPPQLQAKLEIGAVDDPLEREADAVAEQIVGTNPALHALHAAPAQLRCKCAACEEEMHREPVSAGAARHASAPPMVGQVLAEPGRPLHRDTRSFFEPRLGRPL